MGNRTKKGDQQHGVYVEIPGNGFMWAKPIYGVCSEDGRYEIVTFIASKWGTPSQKILVPEYLLDRRGHNTHVLHAKYLSANLDVEVDSPYSRYVDRCIMAGTFACSYSHDGTCETWKVVEEDEYFVTFERISGWWAYRWLQCEGYRARSKWRKQPGAEGGVSECLSYTSWRFRPRHYSDDPEDPHQIVSRVLSFIHSAFEEDPETVSPVAFDVWPITQVIVKSRLPFPSYAFLVGEPGYEVSGRPLAEQIYPAMREAYKKAIAEFPKQADNNIANFMEIGEMIFDALHGDLSSVPKTIDGLWMWYRYAYSTTKSDVKQAISYWDRLKSGIENGAEYHGTVTARVSGADIRVRWCGDVGLNTDDMQALMQHRLWSAGLEPTLYTGWDLVPFSFVADWFLDIGDTLEDMDNERHAYADYLVSNSCYSFQYIRESDVGPILCYYRFYRPPLQADGECYYSSRGRSSVATWLKRGADASVLTGAAQKAQQLCFRAFK